MVKKILFVCSGNQCRSPFAKTVMEKLLKQKERTDIILDSAGTIAMGGEPANEAACRIAETMGVDMSAHTARMLMADTIAASDYVLVMESHHRDILLQLVPDAKDRIILLGSFAPFHSVGDEIPDPTGLDPLAYRTCFSRIMEAVHVFYKFQFERKITKTV